MRCAHYALTPTTPVRAVRCRRRARLRVQVGARVWAVCAPCLGALRALWGEGLRVRHRLDRSPTARRDRTPPGAAGRRVARGAAGDYGAV